MHVLLMLFKNFCYNFVRSGLLSLWFVVATPDESSLFGQFVPVFMFVSIFIIFHFYVTVRTLYVALNGSITT